MDLHDVSTILNNFCKPVSTSILEIVLQVISWYRHWSQLNFKGHNHLKEAVIGRYFSKIAVLQKAALQYCSSALVLKILEKKPMIRFILSKAADLTPVTLLKLNSVMSIIQELWTEHLFRRTALGGFLPHKIWENVSY